MSGTDGGQGRAAAGEGPGGGEHAETPSCARRGGRAARMPGQARRHRFSWRTPLAVLLIAAGCVLAPVSVLAVRTA